ncbi:MAG: DUF3857 domain-containing transglutaminase family protein [Myxococcota bacterium]
MYTLILLSSMAAPELYRWAPTPSYVQAIESPVEGTRSHRARYGQHYLLLDLQHRSVGRDERFYVRERIELLNAGGVDANAQRQFVVDPSYERLLLHDISVTRDGKRSSRRKQTHIDAFRRERSLEAGMYDGRYTVDLTIQDVRPGDVLEIAYTLTGRNPVMKGHRRLSVLLERGYPIERFYLSSTWDQRLAQWRSHNSALEPRVLKRNGLTTIEYSVQGLAARASADPEVPNWVLSSPLFQATTHRGWSSVARWAQPLYRVERSAVVDRVAQRLMQEHSEANARLVAALRFVQDEIRYLSVGLGAAGHVPRTPRQTLETRYGDCKDKTVLFVALLRSMEIEAHAALVSTTDGWYLPEHLPSAGAFDHVIAVATFNGESYWLDPTIQHQRGDIVHTTPISYGHALILRPGETDLVEMAQSNDAPTMRVSETIDLREYTEGHVRILVRSILSGVDADRIRARLSSEGPQGLKESYLDWYRTRWPSVRYEEDLTVRDDPERNQITIVERLLASGALTEEDENTLSYSHGVASVVAVLSREALVKRSTPVSVNHPVHNHHTLNFLFPADAPWISKPQTQRLENNAFEFIYSTKTSHSRRRLIVDYALRSRRRMVSSTEAPKLRDEHDTLMGYQDFAIVLPKRGRKPGGLLELFHVDTSD